MKNIKGTLIGIVIGFVITFFGLKKCTPEPKVTVKTEVKEVIVHDTITEVIEVDKPVPVYIETVVELRDVDKQTKTITKTVKTNRYDRVLKSNGATANIQVFADKLYDIKGSISYPKQTVTKTVTERLPQSGLFLNLGTNLTFEHELESVNLGLDYIFRNKFQLGGSVGYSNQINKPIYGAKIGYKIL